MVAARQELDARLGRPSSPLAPVDPLEAIGQTVAAAKVVVDHLQSEVEGGRTSPDDLEQLRRWLDSLQRFAQSDIAVQATRHALHEHDAAVVGWVLEQVLVDNGVDHTLPAVRLSIRHRLMQGAGFAVGQPLPLVVQPDEALVGEVIG